VLNSSNKNKLGSLTSEEIAPLQDLQQAEPESKSLRDNETTQVLNSSNKNKLGSLTSEEIAPLQDLQQAEPESKSLRDNETTQVLKFVSGEGEAPSTAMQTASTMTIHDAFLQY
jgi:hypothetical protein